MPLSNMPRAPGSARGLLGVGESERHIGVVTRARQTDEAREKEVKEERREKEERETREVKRASCAWRALVKGAQVARPKAPGNQ